MSAYHSQHCWLRYLLYFCSTQVSLFFCPKWDFLSPEVEQGKWAENIIASLNACLEEAGKAGRKWMKFCTYVKKFLTWNANNKTFLTERTGGQWFIWKYTSLWAAPWVDLPDVFESTEKFFFFFLNRYLILNISKNKQHQQNCLNPQRCTNPSLLLEMWTVQMMSSRPTTVGLMWRTSSTS